MRCIQRDDRAATHFAAGARSRRDGNARRETGPICFVVKLGESQRRPFDEQARGFAHVQRAAAAERDHAIATVLAIAMRGFPHVLLHGIGMHARIDEPVPVFPGCTERLHHRPECLRVYQPGIRDDQRPADRKPLAARSQLGNRTRAVNRRCGKRKRSQVHKMEIMSVSHPRTAAG